MLPKLNWFRFGKSKDDSLKCIEKTKFEDETSVTQQMGFIKLFEEELKTSRKDYELACILSFCGLLVFIASICMSYHFSFVSPDQRKLELFTGLISFVLLLVVILGSFLRATMEEVSSNYSLLHCLMKYLPRGPHNPELTKELNQMKWCMRELSNGQNVKDFIFILFYIFAYTALVVWQLHIAFQRTFRAIDAFLNILFIGLAAVPIGMSLILPVKNWIYVYKAKKMSARYIIHSIVGLKSRMS